MNPKHCLGCRDDFYNGKNPMGIKRCWMLKDARLTTRYRIHIDTPMAGYQRAYEKVRVPNCYQKSRWLYISEEQWKRKIPGPLSDAAERQRER